VTTLKPNAPFVWPDPQVLAEPSIYEHYPPFGALALGATWLFGVVPALTARGVRVLGEWLDASTALKVSVIVVVYPACAVSQSDLAELQALARSHPDRFSARILALEQVSDRSINALCLSSIDSDAIHMIVGPSEDLGLDPWKDGQFNLAFQANPSLVEAFRCHFDWLWSRSGDVLMPGVTDMPELALPSGAMEAAVAWQTYRDELQLTEAFQGMPDGEVQAVLDLGQAVPASFEGDEPKSPTARLGVKKLDPLAQLIGGLYAKGSLVTINKRSKIPPLDAPLEPGLFGDRSEMRHGSVTRKVSMRISVIDEKTLKDIDSRKKAVWALVTRFSFGLADGMRWMPSAARGLFEAELEQLNSEGQRLISSLLKGNVDAFLAERKDKLIADLNTLHADLGLPGKVTSDVIDAVLQSLKERLNKAQSSSFIPEMSYSEIGFRATENDFANPWGQAFTLLSDIAAYPRRALTDGFFTRGLKSSRQDILRAMNVADDALLRGTTKWDIEDRCDAELDLVLRIQEAPIASNHLCGLVWRIIQGTAISTIEAEMEELKRKQREQGTD